MGQTFSKAEHQIFTIAKVTKPQIRRFFQFVMVLTLVTITFLAIRIDSPMLLPLLSVEVIGILIYFAKYSKTYNEIYKK